MKLKSCCLTLVSVLFLTTVAHAQSIKVTSVVKTTPDDVEMISNLLKVHLDAERSGKDAAAGESIDLSIIGFGSGFRISAVKKKNGKGVFSSAVVATSTDEIDRIMKRLARSLVTEKNQAEIDNVTNAESNVTNIKKSNYSRWSFEFGPHVAFGLGSESSLFHWKLGYHLEQPQYRIGIGYDSATTISPSDGDRRVSVNHIGITADWMWNLSDNSPYIGTELSYGGTKGYDKDERIELQGFSTVLRVGYLWFRTTKAQLNTSFVFRPVLQSVNGHLAGSTGISVGLEF